MVQNISGATFGWWDFVCQCVCRHRSGSAYLASHRNSGFLVRCKIQSKRHSLEVLKVVEGEYIKCVDTIYA